MQLGTSEREIDHAVALLEQTFTRPVERIFADRNIELAFAKHKFSILASSPLYKRGKPWLNGQIINIGPDTIAPGDEETGWTAFRTLGLRDFGLPNVTIPP